MEITRDNLLLVKTAIFTYYNQCRHNMIAVEIPEQEITSGVLAFVVKAAKTGDVTYRGNRWFAKERVEKRLSLKQGDTLDQNALLNNISWLNQNPFHHTEVILSPGKINGQTDLEIVTQDRVPLKIYSGGDNTGVESTGTSRLYAGATLGDLFALNAILTYQFTSNAKYHNFHSHSLNFLSYLPWQHHVSIYGGYSVIHPNITGFQNEGKNAQVSLRYKMPFQPFYTGLQHHFFFGLDWKYVTSALFFVAELTQPLPVSSSIVNIAQGILGYACDYIRSQHQASFRLELFGSPVAPLPYQSHAAYTALRPHTSPLYLYGKLVLGDIYTLANKVSVSALLRAQGAANALIPSEQYALGGYNTVRGYDENVFIADNAVCANFELRSSPLTFFKKAKDELIFLAFIDYGWGYNYHAFDGIAKAATLCGIGPGVRYTIGPSVFFRVDYGFKLRGVTFDDNRMGTWHVGGTVSY
jgi:hemolysin activation/secretion protein